METKFKVGDIVYDSVNYPNEQGKIECMYYNSVGGQSNSIKVIFGNSANTYTFDGKLNSRNNLPTLSFTPYELSGFTQERPWQPKEGEYVAVKNKNQISTWVIGKFSKISELGLFEIYEASNQFEQIKPLTDFINENNKLK